MLKYIECQIYRMSRDSKSQNILEKEESWRPHFFKFQNILQNKSNQANVIVSLNQLHKPREQKRKLGHDPLHMFQMIFDKDANTAQWGKNSLFNSWYLRAKK